MKFMHEKDESYSIVDTRNNGRFIRITPLSFPQSKHTHAPFNFPQNLQIGPKNACKNLENGQNMFEDASNKGLKVPVKHNKHSKHSKHNEKTKRSCSK